VPTSPHQCQYCNDVRLRFLGRHIAHEVICVGREGLLQARVSVGCDDPSTMRHRLCKAPYLEFCLVSLL